MNPTQSIARACQTACELALFAAVLLAPWPFGCTAARFEFYLWTTVSTTLLAFAIWLMFGESPRLRVGRGGKIFLTGMLILAAVAALHQLPLPSGILGVVASGVQTWLSPWAATSAEITGQYAQGPQTVFWTVGEKLGLNAGGSYHFALRVLMLASLFGIIGCFRTPHKTLKRLSVGAVLIGFLIAFFGIAQHFGSHEGLAYWTYKIVGGLGFGPFVNRNHYPFFLNLAIGLTLGLMMDRLEELRRTWRRQWIADPQVVWMLAALVFMFASLIVCVSRGGIMSIALAMTIVMVIRFRPEGAKRWVIISAIIAIPTGLVLMWVGFSIYESRLTMLVDSDRYTTDGRIHLWRAALQSVPEFLWFGSGGETYQYWETIHATGDPDWPSENSFSLRADNEPLDVLNEYGVVGLIGLSLAIVAVVYRAVMTCRHHSLGAGAAIGLLAVLLHSFVDFGLRVPATAVFATIVASLFFGVTDEMRLTRRRQSVEIEADVQTQSSGKAFASFALASALVFFALFSVREKRRAYTAQQFQDLATLQWSRDQHNEAIVSMQNAVQTVPENLPMRLAFVRYAQAAFDHIESNEEKASLATMINQQAYVTMAICPLVWQPYAWLAQYPSADTDLAKRLEYLAYARRLHRGEPMLAFVTGSMIDECRELREAIPHWRDSLTYSVKYLDPILKRSQTELSGDEIIDSLMPRDPLVTLQAALIEKKSANEAMSVRFAERTLSLLAQPESLDRKLDASRQNAIRGEALALKGDKEAASEALRLALNEQPSDAAWRARLIELLIDQGRLNEATREVRILLSLYPDSSQAKSLQKAVLDRKSSPQPGDQ